MRLSVHDLYTYIDGYPSGLLDEVTSYRMENFFYTPAWKKGEWDGRIRFIKYHRSRGQYYFPTGLLSRVTRYLDSTDWNYQLEDHRTFEPATPCYTLADRVRGAIHLDQGKYSYQADAVDQALLHGRGIIKAGTGAGKSEMGAAIIKSIGLPAIWFTHRTNLLYQTQERLRERLQKRVGIIGDGQVDYQDVTVAMIQTLDRRQHDEFLKTRRILIGDEIHHLESDQWCRNIQAVPATWRFGLSATPPTTGSGMHLLAYTGEILVDIPAHELIRRGVLVRPRIWFVTIDRPIIPPKTAWSTVYKQGVTDNPHRHDITKQVVWVFQQEHKPVLCLVARLVHGRSLTDYFRTCGIRTEFIHGEVEKSRRETILSDLWEGRLDTVVAMASCLGEGTDLPRLRAVINATGLMGGGSDADGDTGRDVLQILGRGLRSSPGKEYVDYVDFADMTHKSLAKASSTHLDVLVAQGYEKYIKFWSQYSEAA